jgi:hypothetical protein
MADDDLGNEEQPTTKRRSRSGSRGRKSARGGKKAASRRAALARARANAPTESPDDEEAQHAPESDRTQPGGIYLNAFNEYVNAHGKRIDPDSGEELDGDDADELYEARAEESEQALREAEDREI